MIRYIFNRYDFVYNKDLPVNELSIFLFLGQLYAYALFSEPLFDNISKVFNSLDVTDQQAYIINCMITDYNHIKNLYDNNIDLLDFDYFKVKSSDITINLDYWEW